MICKINMIPNLYIVGFQKCGSTSLYELLNNHQQILGCEPKETFALVDVGNERYNDIENVKNKNFSWDNYVTKNINQYTYFMEASVCNFNQETALNYINKVKDPKIIFIIRDPIERFRSSFDYYSPKLSSNIKDINDLIKLKKNSIKTEKLTHGGIKYALENGKYLMYINLWQKKFGKESIHIIKFEDLIDNTSSELKKIENFLEINPFLFNELPKENKTKIIKNRKLHFFLKEKLSKYKLGRYTFFQNLYSKLNTGGEKSTISKNNRKWLKNYYKSEYEFFYNSQH